MIKFTTLSTEYKKFIRCTLACSYSKPCNKTLEKYCKKIIFFVKNEYVWKERHHCHNVSNECIENQNHYLI